MNTQELDLEPETIVAEKKCYDQFIHHVEKAQTILKNFESNKKVQQASSLELGTVQAVYSSNSSGSQFNSIQSDNFLGLQGKLFLTQYRTDVHFCTVLFFAKWILTCGRFRILVYGDTH